jgi:hypothetical protein
MKTHLPRWLVVLGSPLAVVALLVLAAAPAEAAVRFGRGMAHVPPASGSSATFLGVFAVVAIVVGVAWVALTIRRDRRPVPVRGVAAAPVPLRPPQDAEEDDGHRRAA